MRIVRALCLIGCIILGSGCASSYDQGFNDGYAAGLNEINNQRLTTPNDRELKIANAPFLAPPYVDEPAKARILGVREPIPAALESPIEIVNTVPAQHDTFHIMNGPPPAGRARILGVISPSNDPSRVRIKSVTTAP